MPDQDTKKEQIEYHLNAIKALVSSKDQYRIRTPDLSKHIYGHDPQELAKRWFEGFNSPQVRIGTEWNLMKWDKNRNWVIPDTI